MLAESSYSHQEDETELPHHPAHYSSIPGRDGKLKKNKITVPAMATERHMLETQGEIEYWYQTVNERHIEGKITFKCPAQITTWLNNCLEVIPVEKIRRTAMKEKQLI